MLFKQVKNDTIFSQRGAFVKKDVQSSSSSTSVNKNDVPDSANTDIKEDNFIKYMLSKRFASVDEEEDEIEDDEFDSDDEDMSGSREDDDKDEDDDDDDDDGESVGSKNSLYDTAKNRHFLVWRTRSSVRKSISHDSDSELSDESEDSDEEVVHTAGDHDEGDFDDHDHNRDEEVEVFLSEVKELLHEALKINMDPSNLILEINGRKHANNIQIDDLNFYLARALLNLPISSILFI